MQMAIAISLPGFNNLGRSVTRITFFWWTIFSTDFLLFSKKMKKTYELIMLQFDFFAKCNIEFRSF